MTVVAVFILLAIVCGFFAYEAHHWRNKALEAQEKLRAAQDGWQEALGMCDEYDQAARQLISEIDDSGLVRVWSAN